MAGAAGKFSFGRVVSGWGWLLNRDGARLLPMLAVWAGAKFAFYSLDWTLGLSTDDGLNLLSTTYLIDPVFVGIFYLVALSDEPRRPESVVGDAGRRYVGLLLVSILTAIGMGIGFLLLILPGIALAVLWSVAMPALLAEQKSPTEAMAASFDYVRSHFWPVLGVYIVYGFAVLAVYGVLVFAGLLSTAGEVSVGLVLDCLTEAVTSVVGIYLSTAIYRELAYTGRHDVGVFD